MKREKVIPIRWVPEHHDIDFDGVPDYRDCEPLNPRKQDANPEYGAFQVGRDKWGVFAQQLVGVSYRKRGKPFFVGSKYECQEYIKRLPQPETLYDAEVSSYER